MSLPGNLIGRTWAIDIINFHVSCDPDYFELVLPSLPSLLHSNQVTISVESDVNGYNSNFNLFVYDETGTSLPATVAAVTTIEKIRTDFPDGIIRFLVEDRMGRRNYYRILIDYEQYLRPPAPIPPPSSGFLIPNWMADPSDLHYIHTAGSFLEGLPVNFPFPGDPEIAKDIAKGDSPEVIPYEMMIVKWPKKNDFVMEITYAGNSQDMGFTLIDHKGNRLMDALDIAYPKNKSTTKTPLVRKRMEIQGMTRGIYGIKVSGTRYPILYSVKLEVAKTPLH